MNKINIIKCDLELNPDYIKIINDYNSIMEIGNTLNNMLINIKIPRIWLFNIKRRITENGKRIAQLEDKYIYWKEQAFNFLKQPCYKFNHNENNLLKYQHNNDMLWYLICQLDSQMTTISDNYDKKYSQYDTQINFVITIISFIITFLGFICGFIFYYA